MFTTRGCDSAGEYAARLCKGEQRKRAADSVCTGSCSHHDPLWVGASTTVRVGPVFMGACRNHLECGG
jgi:hypothetical protein